VKVPTMTLLRYAASLSARCSTKFRCAAVSAVGSRRLNIAAKPSDLVGKTPLIDLNKILVSHGVDGEFNGERVFFRSS